MYFAGLFSGIYANKVFEYKVKADIGKDIDFLKDYIDSSALDLKNILLLQFFMDNIEESCQFSELYLSNLHSQLEPYWQRLPSRLEAYEKDNSESEEYITLKREYIRLSLRIWLIAWDHYKKCDDPAFVPILYFYSKDCETCVEQGEILDSFKEQLELRNKSVVVFSIDESFEDDTVYLLKQYYGLTKFPAVILNNKIFQQDIIPLETLIESIK